MRQFFLPQGFIQRMHTLMRGCVCMLCFGLSLWLWHTLYVHNPLDASWNTASHTPILHPYGMPGAFLADIAHQIFGIYAYGWSILPATYGILFWCEKPTQLMRRTLFMIMGLVCIGMASAPYLGAQSGTCAALLWGHHIVPTLHKMVTLYLGARSAAHTYVPPIVQYLIGIGGVVVLMRVVDLNIRMCWNAIQACKPSALYFDFSLHAIIKNLFQNGISLKRKSTHNPATPDDMTQLSLFQDEGDSTSHGTSESVRNTIHTWLHERLGSPQEDASNAFDAENLHDPDIPKNSTLFQKMRDAKKEKSHPKPHKHTAPTHDLFAQDPSKNVLLGGFDLPAINLLDPLKAQNMNVDPDALEESGHMLEGVLMEFGVKGEIVNIRPGPVVTLYELKPAPGIKSSRVIGLAEDIARSMCALSARIAVVPGKNVIGIELPNQKRLTVFMRDLLESDAFSKKSSGLPLILGQDIGGKPVIADLVKMPHLLVAGTTGSGKSVSVNTMILSLLYQYTPDQCKFIMVDPKMLELSVYNDIPHLLTPVVTDPKKAVIALKWAVKEMESRYRSMSKMGVRNIDGYNTRVREAKRNGELLTRKVQTGFDAESGKPVFETQSIDLTPLPFIVVIVDEMADLMLVAGKEIEATIQRLAQMARAAGIHLIMATQRPSVDVITGTIKANFPTRISFQVTSKIDSRTILSEQGAEQLLGQGDMLYMAGGGRIQRVHGPFVRDDEVERIVEFLKTQGEPEYIESVTQDDEDDSASESKDEGGGRDAMYEDAVDIILREGKASTSFIQRHLSIGYNRAARIIDMIEKDGIITPANHVGKREVIGR